MLGFLTIVCNEFDECAFLLAVCAMKIILQGGKNMMVDVHYVSTFCFNDKLKGHTFFVSNICLSKTWIKGVPTNLSSHSPVVRAGVSHRVLIYQMPKLVKSLLAAVREKLRKGTQEIFAVFFVGNANEKMGVVGGLYEESQSDNGQPTFISWPLGWVRNCSWHARVSHIITFYKKKTQKEWSFGWSM